MKPSKTEPTQGSQLRRYSGIVSLAMTRVINRARTGESKQTLVAISIVGISVMLLLLVTGISLGVATQSTVYGEDFDYWVVPETSTTLTTVVSVDGPQLGNVHQQNDRIEAVDGVRQSTPVLIELIRVRTTDSTAPEYVLGLGVVPSEEPIEISGISTASLRPGDPHYNNGTYDGERTGQVVLSPAAASLLNASTGDDLAAASLATGEVNYAYTVTAVNESGPGTVRSDAPVALFHLSELQSLSGASETDQADQILVQTNDPRVQSQIADVYPDATVVSRAGLQTRQLIDSDVPLAVAVTALVISVGISALFVTTTVGLDIEADRRQLALLGAIGFSRRSQLCFVGTTTIIITLLGGGLGIALAALGTVILNAIVEFQFGVASVAVFQLYFIPYGLGVAMLTGLLALPYPLILARRTNTIEELSR